MRESAQENPDLAHIEQYGVTSQGRPIEAFVIRQGTTLKPTIVIEAGLRAREWLAPMAAMYFLHEIVDHFYEFEDILANLDFVFIPVANPGKIFICFHFILNNKLIVDGYVFSHTTNRAWVKNRRQVSPECIGADVHRNFQYQFITSGAPCADDFPGPFFFSEAESQAVRDVLLAYQARTVMYLSIQATGQQILLPFSYFAGGSSNQARLAGVGNQVAAAINAVNGRSYAVGVSGVLRGLEHGTPTDFTYVLRSIPYSFSWRLPSGGANGWDLPAAQLSSVLGETFAGFLVFARNVANL